MNKQAIHESTKFVEMQEEELKQFLLNRYEAVKNLEELRRNDQEISKKKEELTAYIVEHYTTNIKLYKAQIKAARTVAKARNIEFKLPRDF